MRLSLPLALIPLVFAGSSAMARTEDRLEISFETTSLGGEYAPRNVVAAWVEDDQGGFVKTIGRWSDNRTRHLVAWIAASGQDTDAVSGATRSDHGGALSLTWDLRDGSNAVVSPGDYSIKVEVCEDNTPSGDFGVNSVATFPFAVDANYRSETGLASGNVVNASIDYLAGDPPAEEEEPEAPQEEPPPETTAPAPSAVTGGCSLTKGSPHVWPLLVLMCACALRRRRREAAR